MSLHDLFAKLHEKLVAELIKRIESGEASDKDLEVARKLLTDNSITATPQAQPGLTNLEGLLSELPQEPGEPALKLA